MKDTNTSELSRINAHLMTAVVLAGGKAVRMHGLNKAQIRIGGIPIIERILKVLDAIFAETIIITNYPEQFGNIQKKTFLDIIPNSGSIGGLYTGLKVCSGEKAFFVACDMPFLNSEVIRYLCSKSNGYDVIVPQFGDHMEPLHAIYSKQCLPFIEQLIAKGDFKILNFFHEVKTLYIPETELRLIDREFKFIRNINYPKDVEEATQLANS